MYKKILFQALLSLFIYASGISGPASLCSTPPDEPPPRVAHYVIGNWNNLMNPKGCVALDENNQLKIKAIITLGVNDLTNYPAMHVFTHFTGTDPFISPAIESSDLEPLELSNGQIVYTYTLEAYVGFFSNHCSQFPNEPFSFDYEITPVDENGDPYPIEDYPELLIPTGTPNQGMDETRVIYSGASYLGTKDLCCFGSVINEKSRGFTENTDIKVDINSENNLTLASVFPNPFTNILNVNFRLEKNEITTVQLFDTSGKLVKKYEYYPKNNGHQEVQISTSELEPGFYYCNIKSETLLKTFKVLKLLR